MFLPFSFWKNENRIILLPCDIDSLCPSVSDSTIDCDQSGPGCGGFGIYPLTQNCAGPCGDIFGLNVNDTICVPEPIWTGCNVQDVINSVTASCNRTFDIFHIILDLLATGGCGIVFDCPCNRPYRVKRLT